MGIWSDKGRDGISEKKRIRKILRDEVLEFVSYHCTVQLETLCGNPKRRLQVDYGYHYTMHQIQSLKIKPQQPQYSSEDVADERKNLIVHIDARWLSKCRVLVCLMPMFHNVPKYLKLLKNKKKDPFEDFLESNPNRLALSFLC